MPCCLAEYNTWDSKQKNAVFFVSPRPFPRKYRSVFSRDASKQKKQPFVAVQVFVRITKTYYKQKNTKNRSLNMTIPLP